MTYRVMLDRPARKALDRLPSGVADRILGEIAALAKNPRPPGCKKLAGTPGNWRIRVGDFRVLYEIDDKRREATIQRVAQRDKVYRL